MIHREGKDNDWFTPEYILKEIRAFMPITLDPCTSKDNPTGAFQFYTEKDNGLTLPWALSGLNFVNPPYSTYVDPGLSPEEQKKAKKTLLKEIKAEGVRLFGGKSGDYPSLMALWTAKIHHEASQHAPIIALLPCGARFSTKYWQTNILSDTLNAMCFIRGRVPFLNVDGKPVKNNTYDSILYGYNINPFLFKEVFSNLGRTIRVS